MACHNLNLVPKYLKSPRSSFLKAGDEDVKRGASLVLFNKTKLIPAQSFIHSSLSHIHHSYFTPQYNTHTLVLDIFSYLQIHTTAMSFAQIVQT